MQELFHSDVAEVLDTDFLIASSLSEHKEQKKLLYNPWKSVWSVQHNDIVIDKDKRLDLMLHVYNSI
jgi:hypothetical protein